MNKAKKTKRVEAHIVASLFCFHDPEKEKQPQYLIDDNNILVIDKESEVGARKHKNGVTIYFKLRSNATGIRALLNFDLSIDEEGVFLPIDTYHLLEVERGMAKLPIKFILHVTSTPF